MIEILKRTRGRAFVLFTSYAKLREVQARGRGGARVSRSSCRAPRRGRQLLREFKATPHAVLLATSSFWQGVDVVGEALSCVIIDKLPFASPGDPITAARIEAINARGGIGVRRVPGPAGDPGAAAGARPADPAPAGSRRARRARSAPAHDGLRPPISRVAAAGARHISSAGHRAIFCDRRMSSELPAPSWGLEAGVGGRLQNQISQRFTPFFFSALTEDSGHGGHTHRQPYTCHLRPGARTGGCRLAGAGPDRADQGKVVDADNKPVEGAKVTLQAVDTNSKFELKTKKNGEYMQIGIPPGNYKITAEKDGLSATKNSHISLDMAEVNLTLTKGGAALGEMSKEDRAKAEATRRRHQGRVQRRRGAGQRRQVRRGDREVQRSAEGRPEVPRVLHRDRPCQARQRRTIPRLRRPTRRRSSWIRIRSTRTTASRRSTTTRRSSTEAKAMSAEAMKRATAGGAAGGGADTLYNAGVISWNANDFAKAQEQFAAAVAANPNHAESHFMLGRGVPEPRQACRRPRRSSRPTRRSRRTGRTRRKRPATSRCSRRTSSSTGARRGRHHCRQPPVCQVPDRRGRPPRRPGPVRHPPRRRLEDVQRRSRARRLVRRPARFRREQGPGSPAEDRRNGRHGDKVASHRPPAIEQGEEGGREPLPASTRSTRSICCRSWTRRRREAGAAPEVLVQVDLARRGDEIRRGRRRGAADHGAAQARAPSRMVGLMLIPPWNEDQEQTRPWFIRLRELRDALARRRRAAGLARVTCQWG